MSDSISRTWMKERRDIGSYTLAGLDSFWRKLKEKIDNALLFGTRLSTFKFSFKQYSNEMTIRRKLDKDGSTESGEVQSIIVDCNFLEDHKRIVLDILVDSLVMWSGGEDFRSAVLYLLMKWIHSLGSHKGYKITLRDTFGENILRNRAGIKSDAAVQRDYIMDREVFTMDDLEKVQWSD